jgi:hypothetical protein
LEERSVARAKFVVQHFVACATIEPMQLGGEYAYRLGGVTYIHTVPADREWPVRLDDLSLYVRLRNGNGTYLFDVDLVWLDGSTGVEEICTFSEYRVQFGKRLSVASRAFSVKFGSFPGPGRYRFRLRLNGSDQILAEETIRIRRLT